MYGRDPRHLALLVVVCVLNTHTVTCQCTAKHCVNDGEESDIINMFAQVRDSLDSLKKEMKREVDSLRDEIRSLKGQLLATSGITAAPTPPAYDCADLLDQGHRKSGVYRIDVHGRAEQLHVYCDMETDGGGWLVFQRRVDGSITFTREWVPYKEGFGNISREFWLGNDNLFYITSNKRYYLRIDLGGKDGGKKYAVYSNFSIKPEKENYRLTFGTYQGNAGDGFSYHNDMDFTTIDQDNDWKSNDNCAKEWKGGWWYKYCSNANLNGLYGYNYRWPGYTGLSNNDMKIRPLLGH